MSIKTLTRRLKRRLAPAPVPPPSGWLMDAARHGMECGTSCPRCGHMVQVGPNGYMPHRTASVFFNPQADWCTVGGGSRG